jgi:hypothetical protein
MCRSSLCRRDQHTLDCRIAHRPVHGFRKRLDGRVVEYVLGALAHVPFDDGNAVGVDAIVDHDVPLDGSLRRIDQGSRAMHHCQLS